MDITERTPLIQPTTYPTINSRYIPKTWSKILMITTILDFSVHILIYVVSFLNESRNSLFKINNHTQFMFYDYLILSSVRVTLLFSFCYIKKLIKFHIPIIITFVS